MEVTDQVLWRTDESKGDATATNLAPAETVHLAETSMTISNETGKEELPPVSQKTTQKAISAFYQARRDGGLLFDFHAKGSRAGTGMGRRVVDETYGLLRPKANTAAEKARETAFLGDGHDIAISRAFESSSFSRSLMLGRKLADLTTKRHQQKPTAYFASSILQVILYHFSSFWLAGKG